MNKVYQWLGIASFALVLSSPAMAASLKVKGLKSSLEDNVDAYLSAISKNDYSDTLRFQEQVKSEISQALQALGYYQPSYDYHVKGSGKKIAITVTVDAGLVRISARVILLLLEMRKMILLLSLY